MIVTYDHPAIAKELAMHKSLLEATDEEIKALRVACLRDAAAYMTRAAEWMKENDNFFSDSWSDEISGWYYLINLVNDTVEDVRTNLHNVLNNPEGNELYDWPKELSPYIPSEDEEGEPINLLPLALPTVHLSGEFNTEGHDSILEDAEGPEDEGFGDYPTIEEYVHDGVMINGYDWYDQSDWKEDDSITRAQKDELFDWLEDRVIDVEVNIRLRHPEA